MSNNATQNLIDLLTLDQLDENVFMGQNFKAPWGRVFGGQVLAQSLYAAYQSVPSDRLAHSLHGYFILGGDLEAPITYEVDKIRDGGSFTTRRVVALQKGKPIFNMSASFQTVEQGVEHQSLMPDLAKPDQLKTGLQQIKKLLWIAPKIHKKIKQSFPDEFIFKPVKKVTKLLRKNNPPYFHMWLKTSQELKLTPRMQHLMLAYVSDYSLLLTSSFPHRAQLNKTPTFYASIDHALWFHRDFNINDWLLYAMDSPSASNSRGFSRGSIFDKNGRLVASVAQEGLIRQKEG